MKTDVERMNEVDMVRLCGQIAVRVELSVLSNIFVHIIALLACRKL